MAAITGISESCVAAVTRTRWCRDMKLHLANLLHLVSSLLILRLGYIKLINILSLQRWEHNWWWHLQNIWIRNLQQLPTWHNRGNISNLILEFQLQEWILSEVDTKCCAPLPLPAGGIQIRLLTTYCLLRRLDQQSLLSTHSDIIVSGLPPQFSCCLSNSVIIWPRRFWYNLCACVRHASLWRVS